MKGALHWDEQLTLFSLFHDTRPVFSLISKW